MTNIKLMLEYTKNLSVLYVEDDLNLVDTTKELLGNFFKKLDVAYDGKEGLEKYIAYEKKNSSFYDLIITDINMPNMNGVLMSAEILKLNPMQSIIITSAHNEVEYLSSAIELGVNAFVTKPINNNKLMQVLYKTSQAISDHNFVLFHLEMIEDLNMQLEIQNKELLAKNSELEKSFRMLDTMVHKDKISNPKNITQKEIPTVEDEYLKEQIANLIEDDLQELREIHEEADLNIINIINTIDTIDIYALPNLVEQFTKYSTILSFYNFFDELGGSMKVFALTLKDNPLPENGDDIKNIFMLLESFMYVLGKWQNDLESGDSNNINSLDASMISDMHTITNMWTQKEEEVNDDDLDGIFDF